MRSAKHKYSLLLILSIVIFGSVFCTNSEIAVENQIAIETAVVPYPTYTPQPTYTPYPTYTPVPRPKPQVRIKAVQETATPVNFSDAKTDDAAEFSAYKDPDFYLNVEVDIEGWPLPYIQDKYDPAVGLVAPEIRGKLLDGSEIQIGGEGETTLVMILAHWCPHCRNEVRELSTYLNEQGLPETLRLVSVATIIDEKRANYPPHEWFEQENRPVPVLVDDAESKIANVFGVTSFPYFVVIDSRGYVALRMPGRIGPDMLERLVEALSDEKSRS